MSTTIHSDKKVGPRARWRAIGIDREGCWHNVRSRKHAPDVVVVTDASGLRHRQSLAGMTVHDWVEAIADEAGWRDHPEAQPGAGVVEVLAP